MYTRFRELANASKGKRLVCKLNKALYGTKQGANKRYNKLKATFLSLNYVVCSADEAVFFLIEDSQYTIVAAATDDFTIIASSTERTERVKKQLNKHFEIVDLGQINWLLGIHIQRDPSKHLITLGQQAYIDRIVAKMGLQDARPMATPMEPGVDLSYDSPS